MPATRWFFYYITWFNKDRGRVYLKSYKNTRRPSQSTLQMQPQVSREIHKSSGREKMQA